MVRDNPDISQVNKMHYLRIILQGEAAKIVANLKLSVKSFKIGWNRLSARFDNKRFLILAHLDNLLALPRMKTRSSQSMNQVINMVSSSLSALEALVSPVEHRKKIMVQHVILALDAKTRLLSYLTSMAQALEHIKTHRTYRKARNTSQEPPTTTFAKVLNAELLSLKNRGVVDAMLCYNCLERHNLRQCKSTRRCNVCEGLHHTLIHQQQQSGSASEPKASQVASRSSSFLSNTTKSSQRLSSSSSTPPLSDSSPHHQSSRRKSSYRKSSHQKLSHPPSSSLSTPASFPTPSLHKRSSHPSSSRHKSPHQSSSSSSHKPSPNSSPTKAKSSIISIQYLSCPSHHHLSHLRRSKESDSHHPSQISIDHLIRLFHSALELPCFLQLAKPLPSLLREFRLLRLFIDPGSELPLASAKLVAKLKLNQYPGTISIQGVGSTSLGATQGQVSLVLQSTYSSFQVNLKALILPKNTSQVPSSIISEQD
ncbi:hypothetical protein M0802_012739 [Mischocyttarus mexicanus]|nr:hypothetical protein M0802_012739 [Mischocyttarus mexicanus]